MTAEKAQRRAAQPAVTPYSLHYDRGYQPQIGNKPVSHNLRSLRRASIPRTRDQLCEQNYKLGILVDRLHDVAGRLADRGREIEDELSRKGDA